MNQTAICVNYNFSKHKGDFSENTIEIHIDYRMVEALLGNYNTIYKLKITKLITQHIATYEALNNHIASSVQIISIYQPTKKLHVIEDELNELESKVVDEGAWGMKGMIQIHHDKEILASED